MIFLLLAFSFFHLLFQLILTVGWRKIATTESRSDQAFLSVIVPVRNEEEVIGKLLTCLEYQEYDKSRYEVIVVDDFSEDGTLDVLSDLKEKLEMDFRIVSLENPEKSGKKRAITKGVELAKHDFILTTDADCQMGPNWLASYAERVGECKFIAGPVALKGMGLFAQMQQLEFAGLIGFGAVTIEADSPSMCNGANLGFDKTAFFEVGGYSGNLQIPSGDDEFLLYDIQQKYPGQTSFLKNRSALVITEALPSLSKFVNQRIRWTSKWRHNKNGKLRVVAVLFFLYYLAFLAAVIMSSAGLLGMEIIGIMVGAHMLSGIWYLFPVMRFLGLRASFPALLGLQIIYPFHVIFMGVNSIFGSYTWKGRKY